MVTIPICLFPFADGAVVSPSTFSAFGVSWFWGSNFMGGFGLVAVAVSLFLSLALLLRGVSQSFLISNKFPDILPALGHVVPARIGVSSNGGGLFCEV